MKASVKGEISLSVIITTYNNLSSFGKHICRKTLLTNKYDNVEVIYIDDSSVDETVKFIERKTKNSKNIHIFKNAENKGQSFSRNLGLSKSSGKYVTFIDYDDSLPRNALKKYIKIISDSSKDVLIGNYIMYDKKGKRHKSSLNSHDHSFDMLMENGSVWNKIFSRDFLIKNDLKFEESVRYAEDTLLLSEVYKLNPSIRLIKDVIYLYKKYTFFKYSLSTTPKLSSVLTYICIGTKIFENKFDCPRESFFRQYARYLSFLINLWLKLDKSSIEKTFLPLKAFVNLVPCVSSSEYEAVSEILNIDRCKFLSMPLHVYLERYPTIY